MGTVGNHNLTLADHARRLDPGGKVDKIVEVLNETNEIIQDMVIKEGNLPTGNLVTIRTGLPAVTWRKLNYGVAPSKSATIQVTDALGLLEGYSDVDKRLAVINGNEGELRLSEDRAFLESFNQEMAETLFYGDTGIHPERFLGLAPRYPYKDSPNVIDAGGSGSDCASIWLVVWGENSLYGFFGKGSKAGLTHEDKGQVTLLDGAGGQYEGLRSHYVWELGLTVKDWRYAARICNVDMGSGSFPSTIMDHMIRALAKIPSLKSGKPTWYMNPDLKASFDVQARKESNRQLTYTDDPFSGPTTKFNGIPIRRCEQLLITETALGATPS